jgi:rfaE bifunctional protein kinase chain/domain
MARQPRQFQKTMDAFHRAKIAVLGDFTADVYVYGNPYRLSREAPVVVVQYEREMLVAGGAANAAMNLVALGARVIPVGVVGEDTLGRDLLDQFVRRNVPIEGIAREPRTPTITKTRFMIGDAQASKQQVFRIDHHADEVLYETTESKILASLETAACEADALLVSDHGHNVLTERVAERVRALAADGKLVCADSQGRYDLLKGVRLITPNQREAEYTAGILTRSDEDVVRVGFRLLETLETAAVLITRGNQGMLLFEGGGNFTKIAASQTGEVSDVTGVGDTVSAVVALSLATGSTPLVAAHLANYAAGVVVTKSGARTVSRDEMLDAILEREEGDRGA